MVVIIALLLLFQVPSMAQEKLVGWVIDGKTNETVPGVHVINKRTLKGTITDEQGAFDIALSMGDSILFSNIAYKYWYFIYRDSAQSLSDVFIEMEEQNYLLHEVSVFSYELTTNKPRAIELKKARIPNNSKIRDEKIIPATLANPAEYLYNLFGKKPRQLRKLAELRAEDAYRKKLEQSNNREAVVKITGLSLEELEAFMFYCKFASVGMHTLNDYQFLRSVQNCFYTYLKEKELEGFLDQFE